MPRLVTAGTGTGDEALLTRIIDQGEEENSRSAASVETKYVPKAAHDLQGYTRQHDGCGGSARVAQATTAGGRALHGFLVQFESQLETG